MTPKIELSRACKEIFSFISDPKPREAYERQRFLFFTGAGLSAGRFGVPLGRDIIAKPRQLGYEAKDYESALEEAWPSRIDRQKLFDPVDRKSSITPDNWRLVQLLLMPADQVPWIRTVLTTNFDTQLERALTILGRDYVLCDHPSLAPRIWIGSTDAIQIVHLHGGCWSHEMANTTAETQGAQVSSDLSFANLDHLVAGFLHNYSPLVLGYSGDVDDIFRKVLTRSTATARRTKTYWFLYHSNSQPRGFENVADLAFVHRPMPELQNQGSESTVTMNTLAEALSALENYYEVPLNPRDGEVLGAREVLEELLGHVSSAVSPVRVRVETLLTKDTGWRHQWASELDREDLFQIMRTLRHPGDESEEAEELPERLVVEMEAALPIVDVLPSQAGLCLEEQLAQAFDNLTRGAYVGALKALLAQGSPSPISKDVLQLSKVIAHLAILSVTDLPEIEQIETIAPGTLQPLLRLLKIGIYHRSRQFAEAGHLWELLVESATGEGRHFAQLGWEVSERLHGVKAARCDALVDWQPPLRRQSAFDEEKRQFDYRLWKES